MHVGNEERVQNFGQTSQGKIQFRRPNCRWDDDLKMARFRIHGI